MSPVAGDIPKRAHSDVRSWRDTKNAIDVLNQRIDEIIPVVGGLCAPADAAFVLENDSDGVDDTVLTNRRILTQGANISLTDAGAASTLTIAATGVTTNCFTTWTPDSGGDIVADGPADTAILAGGTGISTVGTPGSDTITWNLDNTAVTPGSYGGAEDSAVITIDQQGRITSASEIAIGPELNALKDVIITSPDERDFLALRGSNWIDTAINDLDNTVTYVLSSDYLMVWEAATGVHKKIFVKDLIKLLHWSGLEGSGMSDGQVFAANDATSGTWQRLPVLELNNGTFLEPFDARVASDGATITMSLEQSGGGDLTMLFSDEYTTLDCTSPLQTIALTAGSDANPQMNWIYIPQSTKVLTKSTSSWPAGAEHIKIGALFCRTAASTATATGSLVNHNINDEVSGTDNQGNISHITEKIRLLGTSYFSGVDGNGTTDYLTITAGNVECEATSGIVYQLHAHVWPAFSTSGGDTVHVKNWSGDNYHDLTNLHDITADSTGAAITNNKYFNIVLWGVVNKTGEHQALMINLPSGFYNTQSNAETDASGHDDFSIPREFSIDAGVGFLICRMTIRMGATWTHVSTVDLRGQTPQTAAGGASAAVSSFADNVFTVFDNTDNTKVLALDVGTTVSTGTTQTLIVPDESGTIVLAAAALTDHALLRGAGGAMSAQDTGITVDDSDNIAMPNATVVGWNGGADYITSPSADVLRLTAVDHLQIYANGAERIVFTDSDILPTITNTINVGSNVARMKGGWFAGELLALTFQSDQATGTAPFTVASTTVVANLNCSFLEGNAAAAFATAGHDHAVGADTQMLYNNGGVLGATSALTWDDTNFLLGSGAATKLQLRDANAYLNSTVSGVLVGSATIAIGFSTPLLQFGDGVAANISASWVAAAATGGLVWVGGSDYFQFQDDVLLASAEKFFYRTTSIHTSSQDAGHLDHVANISIDFTIGATEEMVLTSTGLAITDQIQIGGDLNHDGSGVGFFATAPVAQAAAYTQTYATADRTHAARTAVTMGDLVATKNSGWGASSEANFDKITTAVDQLIADQADTAQIVNALIDDLQAYGLLQ